MRDGFLSSTRTLTGKLAIFFSGVSIIIGGVTFLLFLMALKWSEDRMGERRILIDRDIAIERYLAGATGRIDLDALTIAYDSLALVPAPYDEFLGMHDRFMGEKDLTPGAPSHMLYKGTFYKQGQSRDIILLSYVDGVEFESNELLYTGAIAVAMVALLMLLFGGLLFRLSKRLIEPLNDIALQLEQQTGDAERSFHIQEDAAVEFQFLTDRLNQYRRELNLVLKREQAFARYASHELRTPLTVIKGANKLLLLNDKRAFRERQILRIDDATSQMTTLIDALLALVRYERSANKASMRSVSKEEIERIYHANTSQLNSKEVRFNLVIEALPEVRATEAVLNMVIGNMLRNAFAATTKGEIDLIVRSHEMMVLDDGPGLSEEPDQKGHGLGLLIVNDLCRRYGWQFELKNHASRGCIAKIALGHEHDSPGSP